MCSMLRTQALLPNAVIVAKPNEHNISGPDSIATFLYLVLDKHSSVVGPLNTDFSDFT